MKQAESNKLPDSPKSDHSGHSKRLDDSVSPRALFRSRNQLALNPVNISRQRNHYNFSSNVAKLTFQCSFAKSWRVNFQQDLWSKLEEPLQLCRTATARCFQSATAISYESKSFPAISSI